MSKPTELFTPLVSADKLNANLLKILPQPNGEDFHGPTRRALQDSFDSLPKPDGNFIKDFQSTGFDGRVWELYLNELFRSLNLSVQQPSDRPDFLLSDGQHEVWVEAVTANASQVYTQAEADAAPELWQEQDEIAIKLGGPLTDKLKKKYWELPHVKEKPLILAIADFHDDSPGFRSSVHPLERYAYGLSARLTSSVCEEVRYVQEELAQHAGRKTIPSGFFKLEGTENVSALLFSNAGTVAKFSRMGFQKYPVEGMVIARFGTEYDDDPKAIMPRAFYYFADEVTEGWHDEAVVLYNPYAKHPLPQDFFGPTAKDVYEDGSIRFYCYGDFTYASTTQKLLCPTGQESIYKMLLTEKMDRWMEDMHEQRPDMEQTVVDAHKGLDAC